MKRKPVCLNYLIKQDVTNIIKEVPSIKMAISQIHKSGSLISSNNYKPICKIIKNQDDKL